MSFSAADASRSHRKSCQSCQTRKARFRYRGVVRADRDHTLCFECFRAERDRRRAQVLIDVARPQLPRMPLPGAPLFGTTSVSERKLAHRRAMLAHLTAQVGQPAM
jgi:hypothetical protein